MKKLLKSVVSLISAASIALSALAFSASADTYKAEKLPDNEAIRFVDSMGAGWNLGNSFDSSNCTWLSNKLDYESGWCGAKASKKLIQSVKKAGFNTIRVPVSWHNHVDSDFNIDADWINRVKEVVGWCIDEGFYVIINAHHDIEKGYYYPSKAELKTSKKYMESVWKQVSEKFKDFDEKLVFEIINEPRLTGTNYEWWYDLWNVPKDAQESLDCVNQLNQAALDTIRKSGGNNKNRYVLVGGYDTDDGQKGILSSYFKMPTDSVQNRLIADVHCYSISEKDYKKRIDGVYSAFTSKGVPAIYTEYGLNENGYDYQKNQDIAVNKISDFAAYARSKGVSVILWDNNAPKQFKFIDRATGNLIEKDVISAFVKAGAPALSKSGTSGSSSTSSTSSNKTSSSKPTLTAKSSVKGKASLSWTKVDGATKYAVYKYTGGKLKLVKDNVTAQKYTVKNLKSGSTYSFAVKAYVNGKWTSVKTSDIKKVKIK